MKGYEKVFFGLIRSSLWETEVEIPEGFSEWDRVFRLAKEQSMLGLVAKRVMDMQDVFASLSEKVQAKLKKFLITNMMTYSRLNSVLVHVVAAFEKEGINPVLLKGQGVASNYPTPELRQCGDIDLYVGVEGFLKSHEVLKSIADELDDLSTLHAPVKHYHASVGSVMIEVHQYAEIHSSSSFNAIYQKYADAGLRDSLVKVRFGEVDVNTPSDNFNAFYIFDHLWDHFMSGGIGLRQVCDWMMFLHSRAGKMDTDYLRNILDEMKLMLPWRTFGCIAVDVLGLPASEFPFYDSRFAGKSETVLRRILREGNFGQQTPFVRKPTRGYIYEKLFSLKCYFERFFGMARVFPFHASMQLWHSVRNGFLLLISDMKRG